jgi:hypothetical protein
MVNVSQNMIKVFLDMVIVCMNMVKMHLDIVKVSLDIVNAYMYMISHPGNGKCLHAMAMSLWTCEKYQ